MINSELFVTIIAQKLLNSEIFVAGFYLILLQKVILVKINTKVSMRFETIFKLSQHSSNHEGQNQYLDQL